MSGKLSLSILYAVFAVALSHTTQSPMHHSGNHSKNAMMGEREKITKVNVTVYYEALCKDSAKFVTTQVYPLIANQSSSLAHYLNVTFVPFGKAKYNKSEDGVYSFECHHGDEECEGNKYQACAIKHIKDKVTLYMYINCTMTIGPMNKGSNYSAGKQCADELKVDFESLQTCANGTEGAELLAMYGDLTVALKPTLQSVPEVTFNDVFTLEKQSESMNNLKGVLCKEIPDSGKLVSECAASTNSAPSVLGASFLMMSAAIVASRLY